jgi:putative heme-binding domain-containing protein
LNYDPKEMKQPERRMGMLLAKQQNRVFEPRPRVFLTDLDETVRFLAVKWIADEKLADYRKDVEKMMQDPKLSVRMYLACATALARLDGKEVNEKTLADYFAKRLADDATPAGQRAMLLRQVPATHPKLTVDLLAKLLKSNDASLKMEAVRALAEHPSTKRHEPLLDVFRNPRLGTNLRAYATLGLLDRPAEQHVPMMLPFLSDPKSPLQADAERALLGFPITSKALYERPAQKDRPPAKDIDAWMKRLEGKADPEAGERIFFHAKLATCSRCHRIDGRGADVGPDLSSIGRTDRRHILESILQPSNTVAPHYVAWRLETADGKVRNGMLVHTQLDEYTYLDAKGERFKLKTGDLVEQRPLTTSIMLDGLVDRLTDQEVRDLLAYLQLRK